MCVVDQLKGHTARVVGSEGNDISRACHLDLHLHSRRLQEEEEEEEEEEEKEEEGE